MKCNKEKLIRKMKENLYNNETLAKAMGVNVSTISKLRNGKTEPHIETLRKLCTALKCEPKDILDI